MVRDRQSNGDLSPYPKAHMNYSTRTGHRDIGGMFDGLVVDLFAGGGGASYGLERALGRAVDLAVNHDPEAVAMHRVNHPHTRHLTCDVWEVDPVEATGGRAVDVLWASPDCTHHSKARGKRPIREAGKKSRALAWVVVRWAMKVRPRVIAMENVEEFLKWGPCVGDLACPVRAGQSFEAFVGWLRKVGYAVEWRELRACDYGVPTIRKRLYLIARCDGEPINWPEVTHGPNRSTGGGTSAARMPGRRSESKRRLRPYKTAAECIDFSIPCPSIFMTREEAGAYYAATGVRVVRPLADKTMARIAAGLKRYVLDAAEPFIVSIANYGGGGAPARSSGEPLSTVTASPKGGHHAVVTPYMVPRYGEREGQEPRALGVDRPGPTVTPTGNGGTLIAPVLIGAGGATGSGRPRRADLPGKSVLPNDRRAVVAAFVQSYYGTKADGHHRGGDATDPLRTQTTENRHGLVAAHLLQQRGSNRGNGGDLRDPAPTVTAGGNHAGVVASFLAPYYGNVGGSRPDEPLQTVVTKDRHALVTVMLDGEPYVIVDIGMRMLTPRELYRAQGFGDEYVIDWGVGAGGERMKLSKTAQVRMCGNSVCPGMAEAIVQANVATHADMAVA